MLSKGINMKKTEIQFEYNLICYYTISGVLREHIDVCF